MCTRWTAASANTKMLMPNYESLHFWYKCQNRIMHATAHAHLSILPWRRPAWWWTVGQKSAAYFRQHKVFFHTCRATAGTVLLVFLVDSVQAIMIDAAGTAVEFEEAICRCASVLWGYSATSCLRKCALSQANNAEGDPMWY